MDKLEERLRSSAKAFREHPVYDSEGDGCYLIVQADELDEALAEITRLKEEVERLSAEITAWGHIASGLEAYLQDRQHEGDHITPAMVLSILHGDIRIREERSRQIYAATQARVQSAESALAAKQALIDELVDGLERIAHRRPAGDCKNQIIIDMERMALALISKARSSGKAGSGA